MQIRLVIQVGHCICDFDRVTLSPTLHPQAGDERPQRRVAGQLPEALASVRSPERQQGWAFGGHAAWTPAFI